MRVDKSAWESMRVLGVDEGAQKSVRCTRVNKSAWESMRVQGSR